MATIIPPSEVLQSPVQSNMSLRKQVASLLLALSLVFVAMTFAIQAWVVMPAFEELELSAANQDVERCVNAIDRDLHFLSAIVSDWGSWDDTHRYVLDKNESFQKTNLLEDAFGSTGVDLICIIDNQRRIVWGEMRDMDTLEPLEADDLFTSLRSPDHPLTFHDSLDGESKGIQLTSAGPMLLASRPIITSKREGPINGTMLMGRLLNKDEIADLAERLQLKINVWPVDATDMPADAREKVQTRTESRAKQFAIASQEELYAYTTLDDVFGKPALSIRVDLARKVTLQGRVAAFLAMACTVVGGALTLVVMWFVLQWRIVYPLQSMADHAVRVGSQDDLKARLSLIRTDEIGTLASEFDRMVAGLAESRSKVLDVAHRAGMAEIASEVLHNVGNAVNSANCSIEVLEDRLETPKWSGLEKATHLLVEQAPQAAVFFSQDARAPKLLNYLSVLTQTLKTDHEANKAEVARLRETIRHIRDAIAAQQTFAGKSNFRQEVVLDAIIEEVLRINGDLIRSSGIDVAVEIPALPELQLNKSKMTQVLVNLVRNALQSMNQHPADQHRLKISVSCIDEHGIAIEVSDTGAGFGDDVRTKLFTHGFTTKAEGNGFGLHYCANAIREAGGSLTAQSPGLGVGASFKISLPHVLPATVSAS